MGNSIKEMILDFIIEPSALNSGIVLLILIIIFLIFPLNLKLSERIKKFKILTFLIPILIFISFVISLTLAIKLNNPKWQIFGYIGTFNTLYFLYPYKKYRSIFINFMIFIVWFNDFYIIEKILFE